MVEFQDDSIDVGYARHISTAGVASVVNEVLSGMAIGLLVVAALLATAVFIVSLIHGFL
jgi:hypothetical protein